MGQDPPKPKHDHEALIFPEGFLWGAATSAYQVEGNNIHADWWEWEQIAKPPQMRSGVAANQYELFEQDFHLAKSLGHNSHRLSIEWSRIEPDEGKFNQEEIDHYIKVLKTLKKLGFTVMLTLHHFTNPAWFAKKGGWESFSAPDRFAKFVEKIVPELSEYVDLWITINEPGIYTWMGFMGGDDAGRFPPAKKSNIAAAKVIFNLARAHKKAYKIVHKLIPDSKVGIAQNLSSFDAYHKHSVSEQLAVFISDITVNHSFFWLTRNCHDFIGVNYYRHLRYRRQKGLLPELMDVTNIQKDVSDLGWEVNPEGLFNVLADVSDDLPIYITECGIASTNDDRRTRFLINYLQEVYRAIQAGVKVKGFFYWSLIDNFEWERGFEPRFGLIEVDYTNQKRIPRPSAEVYKEIIKRNGIPHDLLKLLGHGIK